SRPTPSPDGLSATPPPHGRPAGLDQRTPSSPRSYPRQRGTKCPRPFLPCLNFFPRLIRATTILARSRNPVPTRTLSPCPIPLLTSTCSPSAARIISSWR